MNDRELLQSELAALREELEESYRLSGISTGKLKQRLADAERRHDELKSASMEMLRIAGLANQGSNAYNRAIINLHEALNKPEAGQVMTGQSSADQPLSGK